MRFRPVVMLLLFASVVACAQGTKKSAKVVADDTPSVSRGRAVYAARCAACHAADGSGTQLGPALQNEHTRKTDAQIRQAIDNPEPPMPKLEPAEMTMQDVADVAAFVEKL